MSDCGEIKLGQLVISKMGRDKGRLCVVVRRLDDCAVLIADGTMHTISRPKRKNVRHLIKLSNVDKSLQEKFTKGSEVTNGEISEALEGYRAGGTERGLRPEHEQG